MNLPREDLQEFLEQKCLQYNNLAFIENDPVSIPHRYSRKEDIEIAGFLAATISWGNRKSIVANAKRLVGMMDNDPYGFITTASDKETVPFTKFVHRTFNGQDCRFFLRSLKRIYSRHRTMEELFLSFNSKGAGHAISSFRNEFLSPPHEKRSEKHIPDPARGSSAKRINMFLRWMVRKDDRGVDFGIWSRISPANLICPLDVHTGTVARELGLLNRKMNDWRAAEELTTALRTFDAADPVKYDFALFGTGIFEKL
jgi:uncharacterized protein (TIGR02757 family)